MTPIKRNNIKFDPHFQNSIKNEAEDCQSIPVLKLIHNDSDMSDQALKTDSSSSEVFSSDNIPNRINTLPIEDSKATNGLGTLIIYSFLLVSCFFHLRNHYWK